MAALVLNLGQQGRLATQARRAGDPVAFRQHADDFRMGVLTDLAHQSPAVALGHIVVRLDLFLGIDTRLESGQKFGGFIRAPIGADQTLAIHGSRLLQTGSSNICYESSSIKIFS